MKRLRPAQYSALCDVRDRRTHLHHGNSLLALAVLGLVRRVEHEPAVWRLTPAGVLALGRDD